jgi:hypothetical protein
MSLAHQVHERGEVVVLVKHASMAIAPVEDMVDKPTP